MENTINYGIDLGTTNSAIAKFVKGEVIIFSNPQDYSTRTLPSIVGFKKDKILVGKQAKVYAVKEPQNVKSIFKRKMGTAESFPIESLNQSKTPIELSTEVLKELKTFVNTGDNLDAVVITIPASFDMIQSNATKEAGYQAGFKQVELLLEPIAASLAYANMKKEKAMIDGEWLVYDFGGGTFDVALINIKEGEMKVLDHEGNNFLGGADIDNLIIEKIIIPKLYEQYKFSDLKTKMLDTNGIYNKVYLRLLSGCEEAKIQLSARTSAEIVVDGLEDETGKKVDIEITITRTELNEILKPLIDSTIEMIKQILTRKSLKPSDLQFILMVGGSTYIPYVRNRVEEVLQIPVNCEIDPTTAIAIGAAYYAASQTKDLQQKITKLKTSISIRTSYKKASKEKDELFSARVSGNIEGLFYRITRDDGGFNSGLKKLTERISEDLPLVDGAFNYFTLGVYDNQNNIIETDIEPIGISTTYIVDGQPLPEDICLEIDDEDNPGEVKLRRIFEKSANLPLRCQFTTRVNKRIIKGNEEDFILINVTEGTHLAMPESNKGVGWLKITGKDITKDLAKGSDIELTFTISKSRDLTIAAYLNMVDQEFKQLFNPKVRDTQIDILKNQVENLSTKLDEEIEEAIKIEDFRTADALHKCKKEMELLNEEAKEISINDSTDKKYQIEDRKMKVSKALDFATKDKRVQQIKASYFEVKEECEIMLDENGNDHERKTFIDIVAQESAFLATNSPLKIKEKIDEFHSIIGKIKWRNPDFLKSIFQYCKNNQSKMNDEKEAKSHIDAGNFAIESENWDRLKEINFELLDLIPTERKKDIPNIYGRGI